MRDEDIYNINQSITTSLREGGYIVESPSPDEMDIDVAEIIQRTLEIWREAKR